MENMSMSISFQKSTKRTNIKHNNRIMSEKEKERNPHIDYSRSHENKYLIQEDIRDLYEREFGEALKKYNAKQKRKDRKIDDYYKHIQSSKKTSTQQEIIVQVGDKDDFDNPDNWELANEVLEEWFQGFEERNPNLKVYNAVIHNDEASPHLHINFVPVASGYKRGLEKQVSFDRAIKQQDPSLDNARPFKGWREKEVAVLEKLMNERGIERKLVGKNEYKDVNEYKQKKDALRELETKIEHEMAKLDDLIDKPKSDNATEFKPIDSRVVSQMSIPVVEVKNTLLGVKIEPDQVERLKNYTERLKHENNALRDELEESKVAYRKLRKSYLNDRKMLDKLVEDKIVLERQKMARERLNYNREIFKLSDRVETLENENKVLRGENERLRVWKDRATQFMQKANVFERFRTWISNLNKNRVQDFER